MLSGMKNPPISVNEALAKAAEELTKGLAREAPLVVCKKSRTNTGTARRLDSFEALVSALSDDDLTSAYGIALGWITKNNPSRLKSSCDWRIRGSRPGNEMLAQSDMSRRFDSWWTACAEEEAWAERDCAIGIAAEGRSFRELAWARSMSDRAVKSAAIEGVKIYTRCRLEKKLDIIADRP